MWRNVWMVRNNPGKKTGLNTAINWKLLDNQCHCVGKQFLDSQRLRGYQPRKKILLQKTSTHSWLIKIWSCQFLPAVSTSLLWQCLGTTCTTTPCHKPHRQCGHDERASEELIAKEVNYPLDCLWLYCVSHYDSFWVKPPSPAGRKCPIAQVLEGLICSTKGREHQH